MKTHKTIRSSKTANKLNNKLIIGCHISITPSILDGIKYLQSINGNALQIFLGNNQSASVKAKTKLTETEMLDIKTYIHKYDITLIIHSVYLLNFCNALPNSGLIKYMHDNLLHDLNYGALLGAKCVVLHLGFKKTLDIKIAIKNFIANIIYITKKMPSGIQLAIETSAGLQIGYTLEELADIWNGIKHLGKRVGICIDTAHIFVSGYDISSPDGIANYLDQFNKLIGWQNIINFHINDSRYPLGSKKDEHRGIGNGLIYHNLGSHSRALKYIKTFCQKRGIPMILETHGAGSIKDLNDNSNSNKQNTKHGYKWEIDLIRKL